ncbi:MAG: alkaline phosphatase family protein [Alphaproteobacteria bacterium]|nr:alkaline phosphatase family protein [Alphaproteobacteria bacterium]
MAALLRRAFGKAGAAALALLPFAARAQQPPPLQRIAFGSCAHQKHPQPIWDTIGRWRPDLFIFAGDNVYGDFTTADAPQLKEAYAQLAAIEGFQRFRTTVPHLAIWDDHDYGKNDGGAEFALKQIAKDEFLKFWNVPADDPRRTREGLHDARIAGPPGYRVQTILLDTRWFRSALKPTDQRGAPGKERYLPDPDPTKTMLGEAQWAWLAAELRKPAEIRLIVSSIQVLAEGHGWERWGNLPSEREKLFALIRETDARGVVFLSGDRHIGALYREKTVVDYPLHEITASGLNQALAFWGNREPGPNRLGAVYGGAHFGSIEIDWWDRSVDLSIRDGGATPRRTVRIPFADLGLGR